MTLEPCVGCGGLFKPEEGAVHRYMDSSAACWAAFNSLSLEPTAFSALLVDVYAVQHPGVPSNQTINSAAIHLMVLYGVLERGYNPSQALWLRMRPGRASTTPKHERFHWLTPPSFAASLTIADVIADNNVLEAWGRSVWAAWAALHEKQIATWFERYVISERF
jgi:hypothetical protein